MKRRYKENAESFAVNMMLGAGEINAKDSKRRSQYQ